MFPGFDGLGCNVGFAGGSEVDPVLVFSVTMSLPPPGKVGPTRVGSSFKVGGTGVFLVTVTVIARPGECASELEAGADAGADAKELAKGALVSPGASSVRVPVRTSGRGKVPYFEEDAALLKAGLKERYSVSVVHEVTADSVVFAYGPPWLAVLLEL